MLGNLCQRRSVPAENNSPDKALDSEQVSLSRRASGKTKEVRFDDVNDAVNQKDIFVVSLEVDNKGTKQRHKSGMVDGVASPKFRRSDSGAFIIPYTIMMMIIGAPLLFMEYSIGQYFGVGSLSIFKQICPLLQGIGIGHTVLNALVCTYYNLIISLALYYMYASLTSSLPWSNCENLWNTNHCYAGYAEDKQETYTNESTLPLPTSQAQTTTSHSSTMVVHTSPTEEYFRLAVLQETDDIDIQNLGSVQWHLCLTSFLSWFCITMFVCRGIKSTGKVAYFTAIFPYIMLTILVVRGSLLTGAYNGIVYFITPKWSKLLNPDVWFQAATQLFYSTSLAWGGMITMASYNTFHHDCYRDAIIINIISFFTSMYAGVAVFAVIGHMAQVQGLPVEKVIQSGPGLAFIVYPGALSKMPLAPVWAILFFFMIFLLGVGSQMVLIETVVTGFVDEFPRFGLNPKIRFITTAALCSLFFVAGVPMTTQGGMYVLQLMDHYSAGLSVLIIAIFECAAVNWFYGNKRMSRNVADMLGRPVHKFWKICWLIISPCTIFCVAVFSLVQYRPVEYKGVSYPLWADVIGWILCLASIVPIFLAAIYVLCSSQGQTIRKKFLTSIQPPNEKDDDISSGMSCIAASLRLGSPATRDQNPALPGSPQTKVDFFQSNSSPNQKTEKGLAQCHQGHHCQVHHNCHHHYFRIRRESLLNELTFEASGRDDDKNDEYVGDDEDDENDDDGDDENDGVDMDKAEEKVGKHDKNNDKVDDCSIIA